MRIRIPMSVTSATKSHRNFIYISGKAFGSIGSFHYSPQPGFSSVQNNLTGAELVSTRRHYREEAYFCSDHKYDEVGPVPVRGLIGKPYLPT